MWDAIGPLAFTGGPYAVLALLVYAMWRDWLITRPSHLREMSSVRERADEWKAAYEAEREINAELRQQITILLGKVPESRQ